MAILAGAFLAASCLLLLGRNTNVNILSVTMSAELALYFVLVILYAHLNKKHLHISNGFIFPGFKLGIFLLLILVTVLFWVHVVPRVISKPKVYKIDWLQNTTTNHVQELKGNTQDL